MEPNVRDYLARYFPGKFGIGVRRPMGRRFKRTLDDSDQPNVVVGHSFVERIARNDKPKEADGLKINYVGYSGATIEQLLTAVYDLIDGEYKYFQCQFIVVGWENSIMNGLTVEEAKTMLDGLVDEQRDGLAHRIIVTECAMSPKLIKAKKSPLWCFRSIAWSRRRLGGLEPTEWISSDPWGRLMPDESWSV